MHECFGFYAVDHKIFSAHKILYLPLSVFTTFSPEVLMGPSRLPVPVNPPVLPRLPPVPPKLPTVPPKPPEDLMVFAGLSFFSGANCDPT